MTKIKTLTSLLLLAFVINLLFAIPTQAAAPTYTYKNVGTEISATGGAFGADIVKFTQDSASKNVYKGEKQVEFNVPSNGWLGVNWFGAYPEKTGQCIAKMQITIGSTASAGSIKTLAPQSYIVAPDSDFINDCNASIAPTDFNQISIVISGSTTDSSSTPTTYETANTKKISVTVFSNKKVSELPAGIKVTLKNATASVNESQDVVFSSEAMPNDQLFFSGLEPDTYTICVTPANTFSFTQCQTAKKVAGTVLYLDFGSFDTVYYIDGKAVIAEVVIEGKFSDIGTYGPTTVDLINATTGVKVSSAATDSSFISEEDAEGINSTRTVKLYARFDPVVDGTYKLCIQDNNSLCSGTFTKALNRLSQTPETQINVPLAKSGLFFIAQAKEPKTTCALDGIGWLICPITRAMSKIVDAAYEQISQMLTTPALNTDTSGTIVGGVVENSMYEMWKVMRTLANIAFVIAFLLIIFSQMTSFGVSNYGIKKMLPKLIIAAILVNVSYFVCALAIDISNIAGVSINDALNSVNTTVAATTEEPTGQILAGLANFAIGGAAATVAVAATGGAWAALSLLVPGLIAALFAILTVFLVLTLRQAIIILLVVVSPLALVAYILPNTESWFRKWKDLFVTMLLMFPIISAVFAISKLASSIVISGANGHGIIALMGMFIQFIPLAITPLVLKSAGGLLNRFAGMVNNPNRGPFDAMKKGAANFRGREINRANNAAMNTTGLKYGVRRGLLQRRSRISAIDENQKRELNRASADYTANATRDNTQGTIQSTLNKIPGVSYIPGMNKGLRDRMVAGGSPGALNRTQARADAESSKLDAEEVNAAGSNLNAMRIAGNPLTQDQMMQIATGQNVTHDGKQSGVVVHENTSFDESTRRAAIMNATRIATVEQAHDLVNASASMSVGERTTLSGALAGSSVLNKATYLSGPTLGQINQGTASVDKSVLEALLSGKITADVLARTDKKSASKIIEVAKANTAMLSSVSIKKPDGTSENINLIQSLKEQMHEIFKADSVLKTNVSETGELGVILKDIDNL